MRTLGYSNDYPGGYGERMVLDAAVCLRLPDGADPVAAALTEPFTVGEVSVRKARIEPGTVAVVLGCGPVGLGIVSALHRHGVHPIIATEPTPLRRSKAEHLGADTTLDPTQESWVDAYRATGSTQPPIVFNTTGRKGMLNQLLYESPWHTHIFEVSGLMEDDAITPIVAVTKQIRITFSSDGSLDALADGDGRDRERPDRRGVDRHREDRARRGAGRLPGAGAPERPRQDPRSAVSMKDRISG